MGREVVRGALFSEMSEGCLYWRSLSAWFLEINSVLVAGLKNNIILSTKDIHFSKLVQ